MVVIPVMVSLPHVRVFEPLQPPPAVQEVAAPTTVQVSVEFSGDCPVVGSAVNVTTGGDQAGGFTTTVALEVASGVPAL